MPSYQADPWAGLVIRTIEFGRIERRALAFHSLSRADASALLANDAGHRPRDRAAVHARFESVELSGFNRVQPVSGSRQLPGQVHNADATAHSQDLPESIGQSRFGRTRAVRQPCQLVELDVASNEITNEGVASVAKSSALVSLERLNLRANRFDPAPYADPKHFVRTLPNLREVDVRNCRGSRRY